MDALLDVPVILKVLGSLGLMLVVNSFCRHLIVSIGAGTLALAFWSGHSVSSAADIAWDRLASNANLGLLLVIFLVIWLSLQMSESGVMRDLVLAVRGRISPRASIAVLPAIIGWLPMPGGAIFSAPLVADCDADNSLSPLLKTRINYWFRHVWEYWWPLYPGVLLAIEITGLQVWQFMVVQLPLSVMSICVGAWFLLRKVPRSRGRVGERDTSRPMLPLVAPILVAVVVYALLRIFLPAVGELNRYFPMSCGVVLGMLILQLYRPLDGYRWRAILLSDRTLKLALLVAIVRIYGAFVEARLPGGSLLVEVMRQELQGWGVPVLLCVMILPFLSGMVSGLVIGFVGASFPIVFSLLAQDAPLHLVLSTTTLAYGFGYMGMILSPVHICLIVTNEHFKTRILHSIAALVRPAVAVLAGALAYFALLRLVLG